MLGRCRRRRASIEPTLVQCHMFAGGVGGGGKTSKHGALAQCWAGVIDDGSTSANASCLLGIDTLIMPVLLICCHLLHDVWFVSF